MAQIAILPAPSKPGAILKGEQAHREFLDSHILDQISDAGYFARPQQPADAGFLPAPAPAAQPPPPFASVALPPPKPGHRRLHVCISVMSLKSIDVIGDCFAAKFRAYAMWEEEDLAAIGLGHLAARAAAADEYVSLSAAEIADFETKWGAPLGDLMSVFNATTCERDEQSLRLYGGRPGRTALLWNQLFTVTCQEQFELWDFPFDVQVSSEQYPWAWRLIRR